MHLFLHKTYHNQQGNGGGELYNNQAFLEERNLFATELSFQRFGRAKAGNVQGREGAGQEDGKQEQPGYKQLYARQSKIKRQARAYKVIEQRQCPDHQHQPDEDCYSGVTGRFCVKIPD